MGKKHVFYDDQLHVRILDFMLLNPWGYLLTTTLAALGYGLLILFIESQY